MGGTLRARVVCIVLVSLIALTGSLAQANVVWSEGFEYEDSPFNHGWAWADGVEPPWSSGPPYTTTEQAKDGARSLRCEGYAGWIAHEFTEEVPFAYVRGWFYDDGDWGTHDEAAIWTRWDGGSVFLALAKYMGTGSKYYVFHTGANTETSVPMSVGWHLFEWVQDNGRVYLYIDSVPCGDYAGTSLSAVGLGAGEVGMYADSLSVEIVPLQVDIDIKPGSDPNSINLGSAGVVPVAILSTPDFDATTIDPATVSLAGARVKLVGKSSRMLAHAEDVDGDGDTDLVCQVMTVDFILEPGDSEAILEAELYPEYGGRPVTGSDFLRIVPQ
jgi:hypothetical protein